MSARHFRVRAERSDLNKSQSFPEKRRQIFFCQKSQKATRPCRIYSYFCSSVRLQYIRCNLTERAVKGIMKKLTDEEVRKSFKIWLTNYSGKEDETALDPFPDDRIEAFVPHQQGRVFKI